MPAGFQVWDASGNLIVDVTDGVYKEFVAQVVTSDGVAQLPTSLIAAGTPVMVSNTDPGGAGLDLITDPDDNKAYWRFQGGGGSGNARVRAAIV